MRVGKHLETANAEGEFERELVFERARSFYAANGYQERESAGESRLVFERGEEGSGWWTSDQSELHARAEVSALDDRVEFLCRVDTSGQHMLEGDLAFWRGELEAARAFIIGDEEEPEDMRLLERKRAKTTSSKTMRTTFSYGVMVFMFVFMLVFLLERIGISILF